MNMNNVHANINSLTDYTIFLPFNSEKQIKNCGLFIIKR